MQNSASRLQSCRELRLQFTVTVAVEMTGGELSLIIQVNRLAGLIDIAGEVRGKGGVANSLLVRETCDGLVHDIR
jgi:hypothetical protein